VAEAEILTSAFMLMGHSPVSRFRTHILFEDVISGLLTASADTVMGAIMDKSIINAPKTQIFFISFFVAFSGIFTSVIVFISPFD
jgi:hypothetical protein